MKAILVDSKKEAKDTFSFYFKPDKKINYLPGQFIYITLPELIFTDEKGDTRHFTVSSYLNNQELRITTKIRQESAFKQSLIGLKPGSIVYIEGPSGTFIIDQKEREENIFIAGGIGITPFISTLDYALIKNTNIKAKLLYSCSSYDEIAFRKQLQTYKNNLTGFDYFITLTDPKLIPANWSGLTGRIDKNKIESLSKNMNHPKYWISGPPLMVDVIKKQLSELGVSADKIIFEEFTGY